MGGSAIFILPYIITSVIGALVGFGGSLLTTRANSRAASGSIETSTAQVLWDTMRFELDRLGKEVARLSLANQALINENAELKGVVSELREVVYDLRTTVCTVAECDRRLASALGIRHREGGQAGAA